MENSFTQDSRVFTREYDELYKTSSGKPGSDVMYQIRLAWLFFFLYLCFSIAAGFVLLQQFWQVYGALSGRHATAVFNNVFQYSKKGTTRLHFDTRKNQLTVEKGTT